MKSLSSYLITFFIYIFWVIRVGLALMISIDAEVPIIVYNLTYEIILLFVTLPLILLVTKRKPLGAVLYFIVYLLYFGNEIYKCMAITTMEAYSTMFLGALGILLSFFALIDVNLNRYRTNTSKSKKTDWFYDNKQFDREIDERADRNKYRLM